MKQENTTEVESPSRTMSLKPNENKIGRMSYLDMIKQQQQQQHIYIEKKKSINKTPNP
jgi:hypothetical protein